MQGDLLKLLLITLFNCSSHETPAFLFMWVGSEIHIFEAFFTHKNIGLNGEIQLQKYSDKCNYWVK